LLCPASFAAGFKKFSEDCRHSPEEDR
jgi:hypothetical protein